ncbi:ComF family protein [Paenibacillus phyllosphaerae]|nr:hypothetical protein [Paenibacillus phyllosphaerae]
MRRDVTFFTASRSAVRYDETIREWLAQYKYRGNERLAPLLGRFLCSAYDRLIRELRQTYGDIRFEAVIPVPVSAERRMERGFNQAEQLSASVAVHAGLPLVHGLVRVRHSGKQSYKSRIDRIQDTKTLFAGEASVLEQFLRYRLSCTSSSIPLRLLLVDDIYTTGSTVNACAEAVTTALRRIEPSLSLELYVLTLARS